MISATVSSKFSQVSINYWLLIFYRMLRIRTVLMMITFSAIGYVIIHPSNVISVKFVLTQVMLGAMYTSATCFNDAADEEVDKINLPGDLSRPLVTTNTTARQLQIVGIVAFSISVIAAILVNPYYILFALFGGINNIMYSVSPFKISHRGIYAPLCLSIGYVAIPYLSGFFILNRHMTSLSWLVLIALYSSFIGRIILKDFRDFKGDKKFNKLNFLVRHGAIPTCLVAGIAWIIGDIFIIKGLASESIVFVLLSQPLILFILYQLYKLSDDKKYKSQLIRVSVIGRIGNAIVLSLLTCLSLQSGKFNTITINAMTIAVGVFISFTSLTLIQTNTAKID